MPTAYAPGTVRVDLRGTYLGEEVQNTVWTEKIAGPVEFADLVAVGNAVNDWWNDEMKPILSDQFTLREVYVADWVSGTAATFTDTTGLPTNGGNVFDPLPGNVALVITFRTAGRGRSSRGRNYVSGLTENVCSGNQFSSAVVEAVQSAYEALNIALQVVGFDHTVYSQIEGGDPRPVGLAQRVTSYSADLNVDSMRRRLAGRGR